MNETWATNHGDRVIVFQRLTVLGTKWRYQVIAANGELVEHGESYSRRIDAMDAALRHHPRVGNDGLTDAERDAYAEQYRNGAGKAPSKEEMRRLREMAREVRRER